MSLSIEALRLMAQDTKCDCWQPNLCHTKRPLVVKIIISIKMLNDKNPKLSIETLTEWHKILSVIVGIQIYVILRDL
jgi:hypothetical protein